MENLWDFLNKPADFRATYHTRQGVVTDKNLKNIYLEENIWKKK